MRDMFYVRVSWGLKRLLSVSETRRKLAEPRSRPGDGCWGLGWPRGCVTAQLAYKARFWYQDRAVFH